MVDISLGFLFLETRSLTLNIHAPSSGFWYHLLGLVLTAVVTWTGWGLVVALFLIVSQFATAVFDVMWLCSRSRWLGCCHMVFFILFVPFLVLFRTFCYIVAVVLAWSLLLNAIAVHSIDVWLAYLLMAILCSFFMAHACWTCEMIASAFVDVTRYSTLTQKQVPGMCGCLCRRTTVEKTLKVPTVPQEMMSNVVGGSDPSINSVESDHETKEE